MLHITALISKSMLDKGQQVLSFLFLSRFLFSRLFLWVAIMAHKQ